MSPVTTIPDDPIGDESEDFLGRARFAHNLADLIINAPKGMTLRIGVYGGWGEGKTSVLQLMQRRLRAKAHVCVFLQSWASSSTDALLQRLVREIARELGIGKVALLQQWARPAKGALGVGRKAISAIDPRIKAADAVLGGALEGLLGERLTKTIESQTARILQRINEELGERKLIVFIDDLDRVRPDLVPELLLTLREALNQPNYFYVMALAPDIVQAGLESLNKKWGEATAFLEKIIELPRQLPTPSPDEVRQFVSRQLERLGTTSHAERLADLKHVLPSNPRKLKLFLRYIASIQNILDRFDSGEVEWATFYVCQMLRIEFPHEAALLAADSEALDDLEHAFIHSKANKEVGTPPYLNHAPKEEGSSRDRYSQLCNDLRRRGRWRGGT